MISESLPQDLFLDTFISEIIFQFIETKTIQTNMIQFIPVHVVNIKNCYAACFSVNVEVCDFAFYIYI